MKRIYVRGFVDGKAMRYRIYDNSKDFKNNWDRGIGTYPDLRNCSEAISQMREPVQLIGFDISGTNEEKIRQHRKHLAQVIEEHNSALRN